MYRIFQILVLLIVFSLIPLGIKEVLAANPVGSLDGTSDCIYIDGWACDADNYSSPIDVHLYFDQTPCVGCTAYGVRADRVSDQGVINACGGTNNHRFRYQIPNQFLDGHSHQVHAYAINLGGGNNPEIGSSPRSFTCSIPYQTIAGYVRGAVTAPDGTGLKRHPNIRVTIQRGDGQSRDVTTDSNGYFSLANFIRRDETYAVRVENAPVRTGYKGRSYTSTSPHANPDDDGGYTFNTCDQGDTPLGAQSYECQQAGRYDCAGPNGFGTTGRCNFEYREPVLQSPTNTQATCAADGRSVTLSWDHASGGGVTAGGYLLRVDDTSTGSPSWIDLGDMSMSMMTAFGMCDSTGNPATCRFTTGPGQSLPNLSTSLCVQGAPESAATSCIGGKLITTSTAITVGDSYNWSIQSIAPGEVYPIVSGGIGRDGGASGVGFRCTPQPTPTPTPTSTPIPGGAISSSSPCHISNVTNKCTSTLSWNSSSAPNITVKYGSTNILFSSLANSSGTPFSDTTTTPLLFTLYTGTTALGSVNVSGLACRTTGDLNSDGTLDEVNTTSHHGDLEDWTEDFYGRVNPTTDCNGNGLPDLGDFNIWRNKYILHI